MTDRRRRRRVAVLAVALIVGLAGCTTTTLNPTTGLTAGSGVTGADLTGAGGATTAGSSATPDSLDPSGGSTGPSTSSDDVTSAGTTTATPSDPEPTMPPSTAPPSTAPPSTAPTSATYTPPADAEAVAGDCPYLTRDQVQADTGQRMGAVQVRSATPAPVCEFVRNDGGYLATVRVLQFGTDADAVAAVDFYVPREISNPEARPAGWAGGSLATDDGSTYGVSKGTYAVIAATNQKQSVYARLLVVHAIESLGL